jgi:zinc D-Ala-D-Ala dipeptidase
LPAICIALLSTSAGAADPSHAVAHSGQCIVVITESWTADHGVLRWFERTSDSQWEQRGGPAPVVVGRAGLAWGRGEMNSNGLAGPIKREGDDKAPAGVFRLGTAFGYPAKPIPTRLPYLALSNNIVAVDDPHSRFYNRLVNLTQINHPDWKSAEKMILSDQRYKWGIVVLHNEPPKSGAGSCIFLHVWLNSSTPTSGCTAMPEEDLRRLIGWLDPAKAPLLVQLPRSIYRERRGQWGLPKL